MVAKESIGIGLMGLGVIGGGVAKVLMENQISWLGKQAANWS